MAREPERSTSLRLTPIPHWRDWGQGTQHWSGSPGPSSASKTWSPNGHILPVYAQCEPARATRCCEGQAGLSLRPQDWPQPYAPADSPHSSQIPSPIPSTQAGTPARWQGDMRSCRCMHEYMHTHAGRHTPIHSAVPAPPARSAYRKLCPSALRPVVAHPGAMQALHQQPQWPTRAYFHFQ